MAQAKEIQQYVHKTNVRCLHSQSKLMTKSFRLKRTL